MIKCNNQTYANEWFFENWWKYMTRWNGHIDLDEKWTEKEKCNAN